MNKKKILERLENIKLYTETIAGLMRQFDDYKNFLEDIEKIKKYIERG